MKTGLSARLACRDVDLNFRAALLAPLFTQRAGKAEMKVLARRVTGAVRTGTVTRINPRAVAFATE